MLEDVAVPTLKPRCCSKKSWGCLAAPFVCRIGRQAITKLVTMVLGGSFPVCNTFISVVAFDSDMLMMMMMMMMKNVLMILILRGSPWALNRKGSYASVYLEVHG